MRKRLALYFEDEGLQETILVEIPRGAYIPVFCRRAENDAQVLIDSTNAQNAEGAQAAASALDVEDTPPAVMETGKTVSRRAFATAVLCALLACCNMGYLLLQNAILRTEARPWQSDPLLQGFWSEFFACNEEVDIVTADTSLALATSILKQPVTLDDYLDYKYKNLADLPGLTSETRSILNQILNRNLGSVGDFRVAASVMALEGHAPNLKLASARAYSTESIKHNNVILIGGPQSNPWIDLYKDRMDFYVAYDIARHYPSLVNRAPEPGEQPVYELFDEANRGYSIVVFLLNLSPERSDHCRNGFAGYPGSGRVDHVQRRTELDTEKGAEGSFPLPDPSDGWKSVADSRRTASANSIPACSSFTSPSSYYYSEKEDRKQALSLGSRPAPVPVDRISLHRYTQLVPSGSSSVVEHRLAKARVASSNLVSRSISPSGASRMGYGEMGRTKNTGSPAKARYPSGKGEVCKTFMRRFDPGPRLQIFNHLQAHHLRGKFSTVVKTVVTALFSH